MKPKTLVLMGVAIACGLGASYMTSRLLAERNTDDEPKIDVLVAKKNLNMGDTIKTPEELFQQKRYVKGEEPAGAVTDFESLKNRVLKRPLRPGDHVTQEDMFGDKDNIDVLAFLLAPGHRAVGIRVNVESAAFGFATLPLSRVDIISTVRRADDKATYAQVLLENVLVLAADDKTRRSEDGKPMPSQVVTVALKPEDTLKVRLAAEMGTLSLALRKINDVSRTEKGKLTYQQLKSGEDSGQDDPVEVANVPTPPKVEPPSPKVDVPEPKKPVDDPVVEVPVLKKHRLAISEGGKTRYLEFFTNEAGQYVDPPSAGGANAINSDPPHPPRPQDAEEPSKK
jgi:pilus assembly protein CpaB